MTHKELQELSIEVAKLSPPAAVTGMTLFGAPLQQWVLLATLIYTVLQISLLIGRIVWRRVKKP